nr:hypothetical protein [Tanacetum cinerariifolium]
MYDYAVLIAHLAPFQKFSKPFLCLVGMSRYYTLDEDTYPRFLHDDREGGCLSLHIVCLVVFNLVFDYLFICAEMDLSAFMHVMDPTKVKIVEREPRSESELKASVDKLFDEGGNPDQGDSVTGGDHYAEIKLIVVAEDVVVGRPKRQHKKRPTVTNVSGSFYPPKKLKGITRLLVGLLLAKNPRSSSKSYWLKLRTIGPSERFIISSDSSHHSSTNASVAEVNSIIRSVVLPLMMTKTVVTSHAASAPSIPVLEMGTKITSLVHAFMVNDSDFTESVRADVWNVLNDSLLDDFDVSREFLDHLASPALFSQICEMDYHRLFTEFNAETARQACLNAEVFSTWMAFGGNTHDLGSPGEETDEITDLHQDSPRRSITTWEDITTHFLAQLFPPGRTAKLCNDILMFQQHYGESLSEAWTRFKDLLQKVPRHGIDLWLQYCMEDLEQAFVEYASSRTNEAGASQDARLSKFEADFKQQQSEMTNKIDTVLKAITDQITGALPSDTVKNPKLSTSLVLSARSYPTMDPQCSTHVYCVINAITIHPKQQNDSHDDRTEENEKEEKVSL